MPDLAVGRQPASQFFEVDWPLAFMNLHRVASTKRYMRVSFASEMYEIVFAAGAASRARFGGIDFGETICPNVI